MGELPSRIAVTGSAGFLGLATVSGLCEKPGVELVAAVDLSPTELKPLSTRRLVSVIRDVRAPLRDVLEAMEIEAVVHLAFLLRPDRNEELAREVNVEATGRLLEDCSSAGVRQFVYLSSTTVYGANAERDRPAVESDPVNPVRGFQYSEHKVAAERLILAHGKRNPGMRVCILRGCVIMAAGADNFIARSLGRRVLPYPAGADPEMQFLHLSDYASSVEAVLSKRAEGVFNIAGDGSLRWRALARLAGARGVSFPAWFLKLGVGVSWNLRFQDESGASGLNFIRYPWLASTAKIREELGWRPRYTAQEAFTEWASARRSR